MLASSASDGEAVLFENRVRELALLNKIWAKNKAQMVVLYGRRRVGKTALWRQFGKGKPFFYWVAHKTSSQALLQSFSAALYDFKHQRAAEPGFSYFNWKIALDELATLGDGKRTLAVIDELPYAIEAESSLPSLLQNLWDSRLAGGKLMFGLSGSRIGIIESELLSSRGPLYGRAEHVVWLDPFTPHALTEVFPLYSPSQLVEVYAVTGGVPHYFSLFKQTHSVMTNLEKRLEESAAPFQTEPAFLLAEEFSEPTKYLAILEVIAGGATKRQLIAQRVGVESSHLGPYLETLAGLRLLKRVVPVTNYSKEDSRKGLWQLADPFLAFYFRFIAPYLSWIEQGRIDRVMDIIKAQFPAFVGKTVFEDLCQSYLQEEGLAGRLTFAPERVGRQWGKGYEIDVAAISDKEKVMLIGEAKWETRKTGPEVLCGLLAKKILLEKETGYFVQTVLFSKTGFSEALTREAAHNHTTLIPLDKLLRASEEK